MKAFHQLQTLLFLNFIIHSLIKQSTTKLKSNLRIINQELEDII